MIVGVMQPNYLPWLGYFDMAARSDLFVILDTVQYDKHGWRNRNRLLARPDPLWITAPVLSTGHHGQRIRDVRLAAGPWQRKHLKTIRQIYSRAPHFEWLFPELERYLGGRDYEWLLDLDLDGYRLFARLLGIDTPARCATELGIPTDPEEPNARLIALCRHVGASRYIAASASRDYVIPGLWQDAGIGLHFQDYQHPEYEQDGGGFVSHLSIVDALMFTGPDARRFLGNRNAE